jgi:hypothetical protein
MKRSRLTKCACGWIHIYQGPFTCWVCGEGIDFCHFQTGKPAEDRLKRPSGPGKELTLDGSARWWNPDPRDPLKDRHLFDYDGHLLTKNPGYDQTFAGDDRWDWETRTRFEGTPATTAGFTVINHQYGL